MSRWDTARKKTKLNHIQSLKSHNFTGSFGPLFETFVEANIICNYLWNNYKGKADCFLSLSLSQTSGNGDELPVFQVFF